MRIETKTEERTIVVDKTTYIADDGRIFDDRRSCEQYEEQRHFQDLLSRFYSMVALDLPELPALCANMLYDDLDECWVRIETDEDAETFCEMFGTSGSQIGDIYYVICRDIEDPRCWEDADLYRFAHVYEMLSDTVGAMQQYMKSLSNRGG